MGSSAGVVLLVEADDSFAEMIREVFAARGIVVEAMREGKSIVAKARSCKPDFIILNAELADGKGAGYLACKALREDSATGAIPIILTSGQATEEDFTSHQHLKQHANAYLRKPYTDEDLFAAVQNVTGVDMNNDDFVALQEKVHEFLAEKEILEGERDAACNEVLALKSEIDSLREAKRELAGALRRAEDASADLDRRNSEVERRSEVLGKRAGALDEREQILLGKEEELADYQGKKERLVQEIMAAGQDLRGIVDKVAEATSSVANLHKQEKERSKELQKLSDRLIAGEKELALMQKELEKASEEYADIKRAYGEQERKVKAVKKALDKVRQALD